MTRPTNTQPESRQDGPRVNEDIRAPYVLLIKEDGEKFGECSRQKAIELAFAAGLDLVEISPNTTPPVCKIMDYGKFKFEQQKKKSEARKKQKVIEIKEIKIRPGTDENDYQIKMRNVMKFFGEGNKVKITLRFRGREMAHQDIGMEMLMRIKTETDEVAKVELHPKLEGRQMTMILAPRQ